MAELFEHTSIGSMNLPNRFVRSATWEGLADKDGSVTDKLIKIMMELAKGEVGLIISSYAFISPEGQSSPRQLAAHHDRFLPGLRDMAHAVHSAGGKMALQLVHGGCNSNPGLSGLEAIGPSALSKCREACREDIAAIISAFNRAAGRAKEAGFDAVQIHAAHGFLLSQFLSPAFNKRKDEYGGELGNRARLVLEVVRSIRKIVGPEYPVLIKLNSEDFLEGGMTREEAIQVAGMLQDASINAIELSGGTVASPEKLMPVRPGKLTPKQEVYYRKAAMLYKQKITIPLMLVGGIRSYEVADELVKSRTTDYVSMSRPLICEPELVKRWQEGDRRKAECISCNACFGPPSEGKGFYCVTMAKKRGTSEQLQKGKVI
jgi:2,4-dienoyl-CoA reductase-like NADH-dependent reductase (Old Yellow Enzyme family)